MLTKTRQGTRFFVRNRFLNSSPKSELGGGEGQKGNVADLEPLDTNIVHRG